jgi:hypothetical protein
VSADSKLELQGSPPGWPAERFPSPRRTRSLGVMQTVYAALQGVKRAAFLVASPVASQPASWPRWRPWRFEGWIRGPPFAIMVCMQQQASTDIKSPAKASGALALRGIDPALRSALEAEASRLGLSLNALVLRVLRDSLGLTETPALHHDLDALAGAWSQQEAREFTEAVRHFEAIDPSLWAPDPDSP